MSLVALANPLTTWDSCVTLPSDLVFELPDCFAPVRIRAQLVVTGLCIHVRSICYVDFEDHSKPC